MTPAELRTATVVGDVVHKPDDQDLDLCGLTHPGKIRSENQDHFMVCTVHPQVVLHGTSLPEPDRLPLRGQRLATIMLVADGVGGGTAGSEAARVATEVVTRYVSSTLRCYHTAGAASDQEFLDALRAAAFEAHDAVRAESALHERRTMATTLTMGIAVWPWLYVMQVGDSRCYVYWDGQLRQLTRDQTLAQGLVDEGVLPRERMSMSPFKDVLVSSIGGGEAIPEVTRVDIRQRGCVVLLCSDGLTKHVTDDEIAAEIADITSSERLCQRLVDRALERGGTDNITVVVGRAAKRGPGSQG